MAEIIDSFFSSNSDYVEIHEGNGEEENIVPYNSDKVEKLVYSLAKKREDANSPDIQTEIVVYLEF